MIRGVMSLNEASKLWDLDRSTLIRAIHGQKGYAPKFIPDEVNFSSSIWLVTEEAMERVYGKRKKEHL